jgi:hypothetical protein
MSRIHKKKPPPGIDLILICNYLLREVGAAALSAGASGSVKSNTIEAQLEALSEAN